MKQTVLFVDDEVMVLESIKRTLRQEAYTVETAEGPLDGLEKTKQLRPCVIVTDMRMPQMDGIAFLKEAIQLSPESVYMVLSAYAEIDKIMSAVNEHHVWRYISKPWQKEDLKIAIANAIELFEFRKAKKELLAALEEKNKELEKKVLERTFQLQEKNEILQMLVEDTSIDSIMERICKALSRTVNTPEVFITAPFLKKTFCNSQTQLVVELKQSGDQALKQKKEIITPSTAALPLIKGETVLGTVLFSHSLTDHSSLIVNCKSFLSAATVALMQAKNMHDTPELSDTITRLLGDL